MLNPTQDTPASQDLGGTQGVAQVEIVREASVWASLAAEWDALFAVSPTAAPPLRREWLQTWWQVYGAHYAAANGTDSGLRLYLVRRGNILIGALPLYIRKAGSPLAPRRLGFLSTGEDEHEETCAEHLNLLHLPSEAQACLDALLPVLLASRPDGWDELSLGPIPLASPLAAWQSAVGDGTSAFQVTETGPCFVADLSGGFEAFQAGLSANSRKLTRKRLNGAAQAGARIEVAENKTDALEMLAQVAELHQARWETVGKPGCFASPRFTAFHRTLIEAGVESGEAVVARLVCGGEVLAAMLGYAAGDKFDSYAAGANLNDDESVMSPGIVLHLLLMQHLSKRGIARYDHLSGTMRYKQQYSSEEQPSFTLYRARPSARVAAGRAASLLQKVGRKGLRLVTAGGSRDAQPEETNAAS